MDLSDLRSFGSRTKATPMGHTANFVATIAPSDTVASSLAQCESSFTIDREGVPRPMRLTHSTATADRILDERWDHWTELDVANERDAEVSDAVEGCVKFPFFFNAFE